MELGNALAALQLEVEHRRRLEAQLLTAVEEERERLGRDLHDDLSQRLAGIALMMRAFEKEIERRSPGEGGRPVLSVIYWLTQLGSLAILPEDYIRSH